MSEPNSYILNGQQAAEMARLKEQDHLFTEAMGGLFAELSEADLQPVRRVLDVACGPAGWALEVAFAHPEWDVVGIDLSPEVIDYARAQAQVQHRYRASFLVMDARAPLTFAANTFDLVNARLLFGFLDQQSWPKLLAECWRILRPGGVVRLTETETWHTNSRAAQHLWRCLCLALQAQERTFPTGGQGIGIAHMLAPLLRQADFERIDRRAFCIDASAGEPLCPLSCKDAEIAFHLLKPYLLQSGLLDEAEYEALLRQMVIDMYSDSFLSLSFGLTVWGRKPSGEETAGHEGR